jgi:hypothetical protein
MKICPKCKAVTFDDMDICYGCLYPFRSVSISSECIFSMSEATLSSNILKSSQNSSVVGADISDMSSGVSQGSLRAGELDERATIELQTRVIDHAKHTAGLPSMDRAACQSHFILRTSGEDDREILLSESEGFVCMIGRSSENDIVIRDLSISRQHARLSFLGGIFYVEDLNATNFTFLDGVPLLEKRHFMPGEVLRIGVAQMLYVSSSSDR